MWSLERTYVIRSSEFSDQLREAFCVLDRPCVAHDMHMYQAVSGVSLEADWIVHMKQPFSWRVPIFPDITGSPLPLQRYLSRPDIFLPSPPTHGVDGTKEAEEERGHDVPGVLLSHSWLDQHQHHHQLPPSRSDRVYPSAGGPLGLCRSPEIGT